MTDYDDPAHRTPPPDLVAEFPLGSMVASRSSVGARAGPPPKFMVAAYNAAGRVRLTCVLTGECPDHWYAPADLVPYPLGVTGTPAQADTMLEREYDAREQRRRAVRHKFPVGCLVQRLSNFNSRNSNNEDGPLLSEII